MIIWKSLKQISFLNTNNWSDLWKVSLIYVIQGSLDSSHEFWQQCINRDCLNYSLAKDWYDDQIGTFSKMKKTHNIEQQYSIDFHCIGNLVFRVCDLAAALTYIYWNKIIPLIPIPRRTKPMSFYFNVFLSHSLGCTCIYVVQLKNTHFQLHCIVH